MKLASGNYRYWRNGIPQAISEPWTLSSGEQGLELHGQRLLDGKPLLEVMARYQGTHCTGMLATWHAAESVRRARYEIQDDVLRWSVDDESPDRGQPLPAGGELFPLLRAAAGPLVQLLLESPRPVIVPDIRQDSPATELLTPRLSERRAVLLDNKNGERHCRYYGGEYGEQGSDYWLDARGLLQRYAWNSAQGVWEVRLEDLHLAAGFSGFSQP